MKTFSIGAFDRQVSVYLGDGDDAISIQTMAKIAGDPARLGQVLVMGNWKGTRCFPRKPNKKNIAQECGKNNPTHTHTYTYINILVNALFLQNWTFEETMVGRLAKKCHQRKMGTI